MQNLGYNGSHVTANLLGQSIPLWLEQARARSTVKIQIASDLCKKIGTLDRRTHNARAKDVTKFNAAKEIDIIFLSSTRDCIRKKVCPDHLA
jgi:hypothetical protein